MFANDRDSATAVAVMKHAGVSRRQKAGQRPKPSRSENVDAAGTGHHRGEFGEGERPAEGDEVGEEPEAEDEPGSPRFWAMVVGVRKMPLMTTPTTDRDSAEADLAGKIGDEFQRRRWMDRISSGGAYRPAIIGTLWDEGNREYRKGGGCSAGAGANGPSRKAAILRAIAPLA